MAFLPPTALTLKGGCHCKAIRYTISIPALEDRPLAPTAVDTPISPSEKVATRMPIIDLDHCSTCRTVSGGIIQCWIICPADWVVWELHYRPPPGWSDDEPLEGLEEQRMPLPTKFAAGPGKVPLVRETYLAHFNASDRATRTFCSRCGTNLSYVDNARIDSPRATIDVTVGSLDADSIVYAKPDRHGWWDSGTGWIKQLLRDGTGSWMLRHPTGDVSQAIEP